MIVHFAYLPLPSLALHLITTRPFFLPTTVPLVVTVAIFLFEETQVTALLFAVAGPTVALSVIFPFLFMVAVFLFNLIEETIITELIVHLAVILLPSFDLHVITAEPFLTALTTPVDETLPICFCVVTWCWKRSILLWRLDQKTGSCHLQLQ